MRGRDRDERCVHAGLPRRSHCPLSHPSCAPLPSFPSTCASQRFLVDIRERAWMWVSVLRAKVKPVAGVVEVGRIRVTDQRAPREPAPGKPPRRLRRGPGSHRERVSRAKLALGVPDYLACLFVFPSFVRSLLFSLPSSPSLLRTGSSRIFLSFPRAFLFFSFHDHPPFSFIPYYPWSTMRARLFLFRRSRFLLHSALSSLLASLFLLDSFSPFSSRFTVRSSH